MVLFLQLQVHHDITVTFYVLFPVVTLKMIGQNLLWVSKILFGHQLVQVLDRNIFAYLTILILKYNSTMYLKLWVDIKKIG